MEKTEGTRRIGHSTEIYRTYEHLHMEVRTEKEHVV